MSAGLGWVTEVCRLLRSEETTLDTLAGWLGGEADRRDPNRVVVDRPERLGALNAVIAEKEGSPASVSAWYARDEGPTLEEAMDDLGPWREYPRPRPPFQGTFELAAGPGCEVVGTTYDPPDLEGSRRLVEVAVLGSPEA